MRIAGEDDGSPSTVLSVVVESRRGFGFGDDVVAVAVTVIFAEYGKALLGELARATWEYIADRLRKITSRDPVMITYRGEAFHGIEADVILRYPSARALKADQGQHPVYVAIAAAFLSAQAPESDVSISLMDFLPAGMARGPDGFIVQRSRP